MADRPIAPTDAAKLVEKLARALAAVHAAGMVHRDIKPSNVMIDRSGEPSLMDFGLARLDEHDNGDQPDDSLRNTNAKGDSPLFAETKIGTSPWIRPSDCRSKVA